MTRAPRIPETEITGVDGTLPTAVSRRMLAEPSASSPLAEPA